MTHIEDYGPLNQAVSRLTELIREAGGFRFRKRFITKKTNIVYYYRCSQDTEFKPKTKLSVKRDRHRMERFAFGSNLKLSVNLLDRRFNVTLSHIYYEKYTDIQITPSILAFLSTRSSTKTPIEIYHELQLSRISDSDKVTQHQVSYQWHKTNISTWRRDDDPFVSATKLLESNNEYQNFISTAGNVRGLGIYILKTMSVLSSRAKEVAIDATYGTNSSG
ncbi:hypothetical protein K3495_g8562 [Podosphaera aphanis]|nr:hypothetical protein K3495_g8562 [Podosphaera aphanis]